MAVKLVLADLVDTERTPIKGIVHANTIFFILTSERFGINYPIGLDELTKNLL